MQAYLQNIVEQQGFDKIAKLDILAINGTNENQTFCVTLAARVTTGKEMQSIDEIAKLTENPRIFKERWDSLQTCCKA